MEYMNIQLSAFLIPLLTGMVFGGFFDLYRVFRSRIKINKTIDLIGDILFWCLAAILIIPLIYWGTWLEVRLYVWIAILMGIVFYYAFLSKLLIPFFKNFWQVVGWLPRVTGNFLWRIGLLIKRAIRACRQNKID